MQSTQQYEAEIADLRRKNRLLLFVTVALGLFFGVLLFAFLRQSGGSGGGSTGLNQERLLHAHINLLESTNLSHESLHTAIDYLGSVLQSGSTSQENKRKALNALLRLQQRNRQATSSGLLLPIVKKLPALLTSCGEKCEFQRDVALFLAQMAGSLPPSLEPDEQFFDNHSALRKQVGPAITQSGQWVAPTALWLSLHAKHNDPVVRQRIAAAIAATGHAIGFRLTQDLLRGMQDKDPQVRRSSVRGLGRMRDQRAQAVQALRRMLTHKESELREAAARALGAQGIQAKVAIPSLVQALEDTDAKVCEAAAQALIQLGAEAAPAVLEALRTRKPFVRSYAAYILGQLGGQHPQVIPSLIAALNHTSAGVRKDAAKALGRFGSAAQSAIPALTKALQDKSGSVAAIAAQALGRIGPSAASAVPGLVKGLSHKSSTVRAYFANAIGTLGPAAKAAIPGLTKTLKDEVMFVRASAARALGHIGPAARPTAKILTQMLNDQYERVRKAVAFALAGIQGKTGDPTSVFQEFLENEDWQKRVAALQALARMGPRSQRLLSSMIQALKGSPWGVREAASEAIAAIGPPAKQAIPGLIQALNDASGYVRASACRALGRVDRNGDSVAALTNALQDRSNFVRQAAAKALGDIGKRAPNTAKKLQTLLQDTYPEVRQFALYALGRIGGQNDQTRKALQKGLQDSYPTVQRSAALAFSEQGSDVTQAQKQLQALLTNPALETAAGLGLTRLLTKHPSQGLAQGTQLSHPKARRALAFRLAGLGNTNLLADFLQKGSVTVQSRSADLLGLRCHPNAVAPLKKGLKASHWMVRTRSALALARLGALAASAESALKTASNDSYTAVQSAAKFALTRLQRAKQKVVPDTLDRQIAQDCYDIAESYWHAQTIRNATKRKEAKAIYRRVLNIWARQKAAPSLVFQTQARLKQLR